jgi:outer membrane protein TolC
MTKLIARWQRGGLRRGASAVSFLFVAAAATGWAGEESLTLKECVARALARNPVAAEATLGIKAAEQAVASAEGRHWPRLSLDAGLIWREDPIPFVPAQSVRIPAHYSDAFGQYALTLTLPLYQGGQLVNGVALAEVRQEVQAQAARQTTEDLIANTANTYNKMLQLEKLREASRATVAALEEQRKNVQQLLDVGRAPRLDLLKVEVQVANEAQRLLALDEGLRTAGATLRYLMGEPTGVDTLPPRLADSLALAPFQGDFSTGLDLAKEQRPEYRIALKGVEESALNQKVARGKLLPSLNASAGYLDQFGSNPWYKEANWFTGLTLSVPLFDRSLYADLARERIQGQRAAQRLAAVENQMRLDIHNALAAVEESRNRVATAQQAVAQAEESFRIEREKYAMGAGVMVDLLLSAAAVVTAAANQTQALFDYNVAVVTYRKATGTLEGYLQ